MTLSLCVTATGTARFAVAMGYDAPVGYGVGAIFDIAKSVLPVGLLSLWWRRACGTAAFLGIAWMCLLAYSCLATHATVSTAISGIERSGTWKMEVRGNDKAELASVEQQLAIGGEHSRVRHVTGPGRDGEGNDLTSRRHLPDGEGGRGRVLGPRPPGGESAKVR
jgi:hypothetical protein